tara:strand:+ start:375 stop:737 length:363 start_codon:yes stop_codon:yes gene_type:complete
MAKEAMPRSSPDPRARDDMEDPIFAEMVNELRFKWQHATTSDTRAFTSLVSQLDASMSNVGAVTGEDAEEEFDEKVIKMQCAIDDRELDCENLKEKLDESQMLVRSLEASIASVWRAIDG